MLDFSESLKPETLKSQIVASVLCSTLQDGGSGRYYLRPDLKSPEPRLAMALVMSMLRLMQSSRPYGVPCH